MSNPSNHRAIEEEGNLGLQEWNAIWRFEWNLDD